jgi:predicted nucleic acid-binding Zn ribbon protein
VAAQAQPVAERDGLVTIACHSATWAEELSLLQSELLQSLEQSLPESGEGALLPPLRGLRFTADAARHLST